MIPIFLTRSYLVDRLAAGDAEARDAGKIVLYFLRDMCGEKQPEE